MNSGPRDNPNQRDEFIVELLEVVADARDEDITELSPLGESFDPGALEQLLASTSVPTTVRIEVYGCTVELNSDGTISVVDGGESS